MAGGAAGQITNEAQLHMFINTAIAATANIETSEALYKTGHFDLWGAVG